MTTFPSIPPTSMEVSDNVIPTTISFGNGYEQTFYDGINTRQRKFKLEWNNIKATDATTITNFFFTNGKADPFFWIDPYGNTWTVSLSKQEDWTAQYSTTICTINATFIQYFSYEA